MKKLLCLAVAALMLCSCSGEDSKQTRSLFCMDTYMTLTAYGDDAEQALADCADRLKELEAMWSVTDEGSDIYKADHSGGAPVAVSAETAGLVSFAVDMNRRTEGALDISVYPVLAEWGFTTQKYHVPSDERIAELMKNVDASRVEVSDGVLTVPRDMMIDLGAVGKGQAADIICDLLKSRGVTSAILDLGGNVQTVGSKPDGSNWKVGIRDPECEGVICTVEIGNAAVVTSGGYERQFTENGVSYHHIIDPKTGKPAQGDFVSVTVIGDSGKYCDALSTALFVLGTREKVKDLWEKEERSFDYIALTTGGELLVSRGIADSVTKDAQHDVKVTVV